MIQSSSTENLDLLVADVRSNTTRGSLPANQLVFYKMAN